MSEEERVNPELEEEKLPLFREHNHELREPEVSEVESLCMKCFANGVTRILLTRIPYYKNVVLMSFNCDKCGYANNEIQPGGAINERGIRWTLNVVEPADLNRQVVKSDFTKVTIPELKMEVPANSQKGEVTTVEGILMRVIGGLSQDQDTRRRDHPSDAAAIDAFLERLQALRSLSRPWTLELEDISGNCFVENPLLPRRDPRLKLSEFERTEEQDAALGLFRANRLDDPPTAPPDGPVATPRGGPLLRRDPDALVYEELANDDVMQFHGNCPDCEAPVCTNMKATKIPHFKEVIIMATSCDQCGHRSNEVKSGGGVEPRGVRFELRVATKEDFTRDLLKSETCCMEIPELQLEVGGSALGGRFSTTEGLLVATRDQLLDAPGALGDAPGLNTEGLREFTTKLDKVLSGQLPVTLVLDDPAGNSYVESLADDPSQPDDGLIITQYERTFEQNEELGLNDMKTENYHADQPDR